MTNYNVHIYREMRLTFEGIEADTAETAAEIARDKPTAEADDIEDCEGETLTALVDDVGDEQFEQSRFIDFEQEKQRKAAPALLAACRMVIDRWEHGDLAEAARACGDAIAKATAVCPPWDITEAQPSESKPYSVLLLYPDYANDSGTEMFYAFVGAPGPFEAVGLAQRQAAEAQDGINIDPSDFAPLLVTSGHAHSEPLFNR